MVVQVSVLEFMALQQCLLFVQKCPGLNVEWLYQDYFDILSPSKFSRQSDAFCSPAFDSKHDIVKHWQSTVVSWSTMTFVAAQSQYASACRHKVSCNAANMPALMQTQQMCANHLVAVCLSIKVELSNLKQKPSS